MGTQCLVPLSPPTRYVSRLRQQSGVLKCHRYLMDFFLALHTVTTKVAKMTHPLGSILANVSQKMTPYGGQIIEYDFLS